MNKEKKFRRSAQAAQEKLSRFLKQRRRRRASGKIACRLPPMNALSKITQKHRKKRVFPLDFFLTGVYSFSRNFQQKLRDGRKTVRGDGAAKRKRAAQRKHGKRRAG